MGGETAVSPSHILGISAYYHDSAAALVRDGWLVAQDGRVSTEVKLADALLTVNGSRICGHNV